MRHVHSTVQTPDWTGSLISVSDPIPILDQTGLYRHDLTWSDCNNNRKNIAQFHGMSERDLFNYKASSTVNISYWTEGNSLLPSYQPVSWSNTLSYSPSEVYLKKFGGKCQNITGESFSGTLDVTENTSGMNGLDSSSHTWLSGNEAWGNFVLLPTSLWRYDFGPR